jgi:glycosyltransferase involved in cell wall biosynthesis
MRPRLLFIHLHSSSFVRDDLEILARRYDVRVFQFDGGATGGAVRRAASLVRSALAQLFWLCRELPRTGIVYGWFVDYHMVLPVLLARLWRRPCVVVVGGFDGNCLPELGYGVFHSRWRAPLARLVARRATLLLAVTPGLIRGESRYATWPEVRPNGILVHVPGLQTPYEILPTGFDPEAWPPGPDERPCTVCTVAGVSRERTFLVKGLDIFFEVARLLPETRFVVVGMDEVQQELVRRRHAPPVNVRFRGPMPRSALAEIYTQTSVYLQLSRTEGGLPMVLGEAMLCGCIPVASEAGGMPDTVGDAGFLVEAPDPPAIAEVVCRALDLGADPQMGPPARRRARARIAGMFHREARAARLLAIVEKLERRR